MTTMTAAAETTITIRRVRGADLYECYESESDEQPVYVWLDCRMRVLSASPSDVIGSGVPAEVWHGHVRQWAILPLKADAANSLLARLATLAETICDGYESRWDGSNHVAEFDAEATAAIDAIEEICADVDSGEICAWDAEEWLSGIGSRTRQCEDLGITAETTDAQLEAIGEQLRAEAVADGIDVIDGLADYLDSLRDTAIAAAAEDE